MNKDLTWTLKQTPTAAELSRMVDQGILTAQEARAIAFNKGKMTNASKVTTVVHVLLDASLSMETVRDATISGYNEYVNSLKNDGGKYKFSLTAFDSGMSGELRLNKVHENVWVDDVPELTRETYIPNGGTPLHDAFVTTLKEAKSKKDEKHLFVVLTDGDENSSTKYSAKDMRELKGQYEKEGNWTFVYLGANQDAFKVSHTYGYAVANTSKFNATPTGTTGVFASLSVATRAMSSAPSMATSNYFTKTQQETNEETK